MVVSASKISVRKQCELLNIARSNLYYSKKSRPGEAEVAQEVMEIYEKYPIYGYRRITEILRRNGVIVNRKRVQSVKPI